MFRGSSSSSLELYESPGGPVASFLKGSKGNSVFVDYAPLFAYYVEFTEWLVISAS